MKKSHFKLFINLSLLFSGFIMVFSGLLMQIFYHLMDIEANNVNATVLDINYSVWSLIHKISILIFTFLMVYHIALHWKWFKAIIKKKLMSKNKVVIILSIIFILVTISGYIPWIIMLTKGEIPLRIIFIEIHDKIALILMVFLIGHVLKRMKWYRSAISKFKNNNLPNLTSIRIKKSHQGNP